MQQGYIHLVTVWVKPLTHPTNERKCTSKLHTHFWKHAFNPETGSKKMHSVFGMNMDQACQTFTTC